MKSVINIRKVLDSTGFCKYKDKESLSSIISMFRYYDESYYYCYCPYVNFTGTYYPSSLQTKHTKIACTCKKTGKLCTVSLSGNIRDCYKIKEINNEKHKEF